jgi:phage regulator Rha-like protein
VGGNWFSENVTLANRVSGKRPWKIKSPPVAGWGKVKKINAERKKEKRKSMKEKETIEKREHRWIMYNFKVPLHASHVALPTSI